MHRLGMAGLLAMVTLAACGQLPEGPGQESRPEAELVDAVDCTSAQHIVQPESPSAPPPPEAGSVPDTFVPVDVIRCDAMVATTMEDDEGLWSAVTEFAVLWPLADGLEVGAPLMVELDGCQRLFGLDGAARSLPQEARAAVVVAVEK